MFLVEDGTKGRGLWVEFQSLLGCFSKHLPTSSVLRSWHHLVGSLGRSGSRVLFEAIFSGRAAGICAV